MGGEQKRIKVLHVDDEPDFLVLTKVSLERENENFSVDTAYSAEEGIELLKGGKYDVVVADYKMPGMDGLEFLQNLRASGNTIPFIMFTGKGREEVAIAALNNGANHYLQKGGDIESMFGTLAHVIKEEAEKKRVEEALRESKERYRLLAENVRDVIWTLDIKNLRFTYMTPSVMHLTGHSVEEVMSLTLEEMLTPASYELAMKTLAEELAIEKMEQKDRGKSRTLELELNCKDGPTVWVEAKMTFLRDADSQPVGILGVSRDITERKRVEEALKESETKYRGLAENINDLLVRIDLRGNITYVSKSFEEKTGYSCEEIEDRNMQDFLIPQSYRTAMERIREWIEGAKSLPPYEIGVKAKDGRIIPFEVNTSPIIEGGNLKAVQIIARDITERRDAEKALIRLSTAVKMSTDSIVITDLDAKIIEVNEATLKMYGTDDRRDLIGKNSFDLIAPEDREKALAGMKEVLEKGYLRSEEYDIIAKDGSRIPVEMSIALMKDADGKPAGFIGVSRDVTERKRAEEELRELNEELEEKIKERTEDLKKEQDYTRHLIESSPDFQLSVAEDGRILDLNKAFEEIIGKNRRDIIGNSIYDYLQGYEIEELLREVVEKKRVRNVELTVNIQGKGRLILSFSGTVFSPTAGEEYVFITGRDITELRIKEMLLIHADRLAALGEIATGVAHEINQPLTVISLATEGILRDIEKYRFDASTLQQDLEAILKNIKRIERIITHLCTYTRKPEYMRMVKPEVVLHNAFILLSEQFRMHDISVSRKIEENLPAIKVDVNQLEQVFVNILTNARQVLDERGEEAEREGTSFQKQLVCGISREREKDQVVFEFADNAFGVPEELKTRVFAPFFTTKEAGEGTGLGLSIASCIVSSFGGKIWVEDNEMGGASFKVAIPVAS